jgi:hypothetical protein
VDPTEQEDPPVPERTDIEIPAASATPRRGRRAFHFLAMMLVAAAAACGGSDAPTAPVPPDPPPVPGVRLKDIVIPRLPAPYYHFTYDAAGRVDSVSFASELTRYQVAYLADGRIKEMRNNINRLVNCETANLDKIVDASMRQINRIKVLKKYKAIDNLPDNLRELAYLRLKHNNASLKELGEMLNPPLGKSGVNHRLRKIEEIAEELLEQEKRGVKNEITKGNVKK